jgi:hypothetical protein
MLIKMAFFYDHTVMNPHCHSSLRSACGLLLHVFALRLLCTVFNKSIRHTLQVLSRHNVSIELSSCVRYEKS